MKRMLMLVMGANMFFAGCEPQQKNVATNETSAMGSEIQKAANELNKQIDVFSAQIQNTTDVLKKEMPVVSKKIQGLMAELQKATKEVQDSLDGQSLPRRPADAKVERPAQEPLSLENYDKAILFYKKAGEETQLDRILKNYEEALRYAQFSLDIERLDLLKSKEINAIIVDARDRINEYSEKVKIEKEMDRLRETGSWYATKGAYALSRQKADVARQYYNLAIKAYREALDYAEEDTDRKYIESEIADIRAVLEEMGAKILILK